ISDGGIQTVKIPSCLASGDYLMRFELIALHSAGSEKGAQFYMECAQFRVTGSTSPKAPTTYKIPGIYSANDPGILVSIYNGKGQPYPPSGYKIPGPALFQCNSGGGAPVLATTPASPLTTTSQQALPAATTPTTLKTVTSAAKPAASTKSVMPRPSGGEVAKYGQCGGRNYTGKTGCASGSSCKFKNPWYSQCL
ncbi:hypothetical protein LTR95_004824, partial [Oleoguttula sp. CCFEE 5521]